MYLLEDNIDKNDETVIEEEVEVLSIDDKESGTYAEGSVSIDTLNILKIADSVLSIEIGPYIIYLL